jgi:mercuric ion binding protein
MKILIISLLILVVLLAVVFTNFNASIALSEEIASAKEVALKVDGMTCGICSLTIKTALKKLDGVVGAEVSYKDKVAKVWYQGSDITVDEIIKAIENAGDYKATPLDKEDK